LKVKSIPVDQSEETRLRLLRLIEHSPDLTQRALARELRFSLGATNYALRALICKGLVKVERFSKSSRKRGYLYLLTPAGLAEKASLTGRFLRLKMAEYEALGAEVEMLARDASEQTGGAGRARDTGI
jgi:EPS-associated MarR family transcriptional regulator